MKILVNGKIKSLELFCPGFPIDFAEKVLMDNDAFEGIDQIKHIFKMSQSAFEIWVNYFNIEQNLLNRAKAIKPDLTYDLQEQFFTDILNCYQTEIFEQQSRQRMIIGSWETLIKNKKGNI